MYYKVYQNMGVIILDRFQYNVKDEDLAQR